MNRLEKLGYILIGVGIGGLVSTILYERELNKPIGEVEEYIPHEDREDSSEEKSDGIDEKNDIIESSDSIEDLMNYKSSVNDISSNYRSNASEDEQRRLEFEARRKERTSHATRYSRMYRGEVDGNSPLNSVDTSKLMSDVEIERQKRLEELSVQDDIPEDDAIIDGSEESEDAELARERVEKNFEIYLGEPPQDYVPLIFYDGDNTLTDDQERIVPEAFDIVGEVALSRLITGGPGAEEGVIYVRNLKTMINYEVVLDAGSYSETVLGIFHERKKARANGADTNGKSG